MVIFLACQHRACSSGLSLRVDATSTCEYCWDLGAVTCENEPDSHMSINCIEDYFLSNDGQCLTW